MIARFKPLPLLEGAQAQAADPQAHATLSASAGTGKTQVLTARVLRLLLQGARPESILCLTFTKAAAAEMANRIGARLASWVRLSDKVLKKELFALGERDDPRMIERARQLFARVLDCAGGLKIQTIHSFAQTLLAAFPAEADIVPGFQPIEGRAEQELVRRTLADLLADAEATGNSQLMSDVQCLSRRLGENGAVDYLRACAGRAEALAQFGDSETIEARLRQVMGLPEGAVETYLADHCADDRFDCDLMRAIAEANRRWSAATGAKVVETIERWLAMAPDQRAAALPEVALLVFTGSGEPRKVTAGQRKADAGYDQHAERLAQAVSELLAIQRGSALAADMAAGLRAGQAFAEAYTRAKRSAGVADFNDLIDWTRRLLATPGMGDWVRYKLDRQIDHVLVDEAQDTNAAQWEIVRKLVEEFFTGSSEADERWRTLFVVGDFKQAIYGFQGTDPNQFERAVTEFRGQAEALQAAEETLDAVQQRAREFRELSIAASFRSAQPVLDAVDSVIGQLGYAALALPEAPERHRAFHRDRPGSVELWQPVPVEDGDEDADQGEERWVDIRDRDYAKQLAGRIKRLVDEAPVLASVGRKLTAGDILVLVRSRGELASLLVARLFSAGVPVAGLDRLHLHEPLAVQDLLAAVRFAVQADDDLSLAELLVSPLFSWTQEQLFELAAERRGHLWRALRERSGENPLFRSADDQLRELLRIADYVSPSQFLEAILSGPIQGRRRLYSRLGVASRDPIDELMNSALEFERNEIASLDRFLSWFSRGEVDVQRDPAQPGNEVRVMTVHGAKGLEAPVVILADATADPARLGRTPLTLDYEIEGVGRSPLLRPKKEERSSPFAELIAAQEQRDLEEHWRLLYVAMTRAADRLIVSGVASKKERPANCWHRIVEQGLAALGVDAEKDHEGRIALTYGSKRQVAARAGKGKAEIGPIGIPDWVRKPAPKESRPPRPLAPSTGAADTDTSSPPSDAMRAAARRGTIIHQLLERLVAVESGDRPQAAATWLEQSAGVTDAHEREDLVALVCGILSDARFSAVFGPGSLGEAPLAATLEDGRVIAGTVDRLLVEQDRVVVIDFKTGRVPASEAEIPPSHRQQMQAYADALRVIFRGRHVTAALLYTSGPSLFPLAA
ncbi:MAG: FIG061771: ATP-dependent nuclease subunit A [uncultured Sphingomonas sp.]|uniref:DNA 3'-5' helicase n=1 Tax=uncultured Sphingomonas sp. TaxID=158754 RepID=A0A6J4SEI3_9SPHN|nr:MAG: FIG061771: ATP-dependent nuclease subunit A [uncultured Sphingomonas sp.]